MQAGCDLDRYDALSETSHHPISKSSYTPLSPSLRPEDWKLYIISFPPAFAGRPHTAARPSWHRIPATSAFVYHGLSCGGYRFPAVKTTRSARISTVTIGSINSASKQFNWSRGKRYTRRRLGPCSVPSISARAVGEAGKRRQRAGSSTGRRDRERQAKTTRAESRR